MYNCYLANRFGTIIAQIRPQLGTLQWRLNEISRCELQISKNDAKVIERNFRFGNRILIEFIDEDLPNWGGILDIPYVWNATSLSVSAYSIEYLLQFRITQKTRFFQNVPVGEVFRRLLLEAEQRQSFGLVIGSIWKGGRHHNLTFHFETLWNIIQNSVVKLEGVDIQFVPKIVDGEIKFVARLFEELGEDKSTRVLLKEGRNISEVSLTQQGTIINEFVAVGAGSTWGPERKSSIYQNRASDQTYGLRQGSRVYSEATLQNTVDRFARTEVKNNAQPKTLLNVRAVNRLPSEFSKYSLGDVVLVVLPTFTWDGYSAACRITSMEYSFSDGSLTLVLEEEKAVDTVYIGSGDEQTQE